MLLVGLMAFTASGATQESAVSAFGLGDGKMKGSPSVMCGGRKLLLYRYQGKLKETEEMYQRALKENEKTWRPEHTSALSQVKLLR